jgi:hypothetical protein
MVFTWNQKQRALKARASNAKLAFSTLRNQQKCPLLQNEFTVTNGKSQRALGHSTTTMKTPQKSLDKKKKKTATPMNVTTTTHDIIGVDLSSSLQHAKNRMAEKEMQWNEQYLKLCSFYDLYGHSNVPTWVNLEGDTSCKFVRWYERQKKSFKDGTIRYDRKEMLDRLDFEESLEFDWDEHNVKEAKEWEDMLEELKRHKTPDSNDSFNVLSKTLDTKLFHWLNTQLYLYRCRFIENAPNKLSDERVHAFKTAGFPLEADANHKQKEQYVMEKVVSDLQVEKSVGQSLPNKSHNSPKQWVEDIHPPPTYTDDTFAASNEESSCKDVSTLKLYEHPASMEEVYKDTTKLMLSSFPNSTSPAVSVADMDSCRRDIEEHTAGDRIEVYWGGDDAWYTGTLTKCSKKTGNWRVNYDDGDTAVLNLSREIYRRLLKKKDSAAPATVKSVEYAMKHSVGTRVKVFWPKDDDFFPATLVKYDADQGKWHVHYDDGDKEYLNLAMETYRVVEEGVRPVKDEGIWDAGLIDGAATLQAKCVLNPIKDESVSFELLPAKISSFESIKYNSEDKVQIHVGDRVVKTETTFVEGIIVSRSESGFMVEFEDGKWDVFHVDDPKLLGFIEMAARMLGKKIKDEDPCDSWKQGDRKRKRRREAEKEDNGSIIAYV